MEGVVRCRGQPGVVRRERRKVGKCSALVCEMVLGEGAGAAASCVVSVTEKKLRDVRVAVGGASVGAHVVWKVEGSGVGEPMRAAGGALSPCARRTDLAVSAAARLWSKFAIAEPPLVVEAWY